MSLEGGREGGEGGREGAREGGREGANEGGREGLCHAEQWYVITSDVTWTSGLSE